MTRLLVVEDDLLFGSLISETLLDLGLEVRLVQSVADALEEDLAGFEGAMIDVMLPNDPDETGITNEESRGSHQTGIALARRFKVESPELRIILFSGGFATLDARNWATENEIPFVNKSDGRGPFLFALKKLGLGEETAPTAFIVHGHDETRLLQCKDFIRNRLGWNEPVVLREQHSGGKTIIEKFEKYSKLADFVFVLLTPDDVVLSETFSNDEMRRSRPNVIFEMGFFYGQLGRESGRIIVLHDGPTELPSDIDGVVWIDISSGVEAAGERIRRELEGFT